MTWTERERRLLEAGRSVEPEAATSRDRLLIQIASSSAIGLAAASVKAAIALEAQSALYAMVKSGLATLAKATLVGGAAGMALSTTSDALDVHALADPVFDNTLPAMVEDATEGPSRAADDVIRNTDRAPSPAPAPTDPPPHRAPALSPSVVATPEEASPDTPPGAASGEALAALDEAKSALDGGDVDKAERALAAYDALPSRGALDPEAALLRLQLLVATGRGDAAATLARQWLSQRPDTAYAPVLRRIAKETP